MNQKFIEVNPGELVNLNSIVGVRPYTRGSEYVYNIITPYADFVISKNVYLKLRDILSIINLCNND